MSPGRRRRPHRFADRHAAGRALAEWLASESLAAPMVLALPRGGVPVGYEVAVALGAPLDVFVARKVGAPGHEEYGIGAIAEGRDDLVVTDAGRRLGHDAEALEGLARRERAEVGRRVERYRGGRDVASPAGRDVVLVDDGIATGVTAEAALLALRERGPSRLILAVPVAAPDSAARLVAIADHVVALLAPAHFMAVGEHYGDFAPTTDDEVVALLAREIGTGSGRRRVVLVVHGLHGHRDGDDKRRIDVARHLDAVRPSTNPAPIRVWGDTSGMRR